MTIYVWTTRNHKNSVMPHTSRHAMTRHDTYACMSRLTPVAMSRLTPVAMPRLTMTRMHECHGSRHQ